MLLLLAALTGEAVLGQKQEKSWKEWTKADAEKILNRSPWGQQQVDPDL